MLARCCSRDSRDFGIVIVAAPILALYIRTDIGHKKNPAHLTTFKSHTLCELASPSINLDQAIMKASMCRRTRARILGALAVLLVLANLECFAACLVSPCDAAPQVVKLPLCHHHAPTSGSRDLPRCPRQTWVNPHKT